MYETMGTGAGARAYALLPANKYTHACCLLFEMNFEK